SPLTPATTSPRPRAPIPPHAPTLAHSSLSAPIRDLPVASLGDISNESARGHYRRVTTLRKRSKGAHVRRYPWLERGNRPLWTIPSSASSLGPRRVAFSTPIRENVQQIIVTSADFGPVSTLEELGGRQVY